MGPDSVHSGRLSSDIFAGSLDHDIMPPHGHHGPPGSGPPGTPPMDGWGSYGSMLNGPGPGMPGFHNNNGIMERRNSPGMNGPMNGPMNGHLMALDNMAPMMAGNQMAPRMMPPDIADNGRGYPDFVPPNSNHVECY